MFSFLGHYIGTGLCCSEQSLDCDGVVVVMAAFRIFLEKTYSFFILLPCTSLLNLCVQSAAASVAQMLVCPENTL